MACPRLDAQLFPPTERLTLTVPAFVLTVSVAERLPFAVGVNMYWNVQLWPPLSAMFTAQVPLRAKSPGFAPPVASEAIVSVPPPVFFNVTVFAELVVPTFRLPKFSDDALSVAIGVAIGAGVTTSPPLQWP